MMHIDNSHGYTLKNQKSLPSKEFGFVACKQSTTKVEIEFPTFLKRIYNDMCR